MKDWTLFHWMVLVAMLILIGFSWASYVKQKRVTDQLKTNQKLTQEQLTEASRPITAQDLFNLIREQFQREKSQVTITTP